jgi:mannosyltransferase
LVVFGIEDEELIFVANEEQTAVPRPAEQSAAGRVQLSTRNAQWLLALIVLVAAMLRIHGIAAKSFWLDEGISVGIARLPWAQFWYIVWHREANMALYYLLLRVWLVLRFSHHGASEGYIRGLSVLFSVATVPVIYALGSRLFGRTAGLVAAWLLAINAYHIRYAQEARSYALVVLLATLATWILVRNLQDPSNGRSRFRWLEYSVVCALTIYSHFFGALVVAAHGVAFLFLPRHKAPWTDYLRSLRWLAYMMIPVAWIAVTVGGGSMKWIPPVSVGAVIQFCAQMAGNGGYWLLALYAMVICVSAYFEWRSAKSAGNEGSAISGWSYKLLFAWLFVPLAIVLAGSTFRPMFMARYLIFSLPALVLAVAGGIEWFRPRKVAWVFIAAITALCFLGTFSYYRQDFDLERDDWRAATSYVLGHALPGDGAFFYIGSGRLPFEYYVSLRRPAPAWPEDLIAANGGDWAYKDSLNAYLADALANTKPAGDRLWLVLSQDRGVSGQPREESVMLSALYGKGRRLIDERRISGITILLYSRGGTEQEIMEPGAAR